MSDHKESIFKASIRALFVTLFAVAGFFLAFIPIGIVLAMTNSGISNKPNTQLSLAPNAEGEVHQENASCPVLLKINISGVIGLRDLTQDNLRTVLAESHDGVLSGQRVKGVLLYINTPGGTAYDSDRMCQMMKAYKHKYNVPVYAFIDGMCASGGMYIACSADKIYATKTSLIGSVGVLLGPTFNYSQAMDKIGVQSLTMTEGKDKDALNPFRAWAPGEDSNLRQITELLYNDFVDEVLSARKAMTKAKLVGEYGAHIFLGPDAQSRGYVDKGDVDYSQTVKDLAIASGIDVTKTYQVLEIQVSRPFLQDLIQNKAAILRGEIKHTLEIPGILPEALQSKPLYLYISN